MNIKLLKSSTILAVGYDPESRQMRIYFHNQGLHTAIWEYEDVAQELVADLIHAESPGRFFNTIKGELDGHRLTNESSADAIEEAIGQLMEAKKDAGELNEVEA